MAGRLSCDLLDHTMVEDLTNVLLLELPGLYVGEPVGEELAEAWLAAGVLAPAAGNEADDEQLHQEELLRWHEYLRKFCGAEGIDVKELRAMAGTGMKISRQVSLASF